MWKKSNPAVELASKTAAAVRSRTASSTAKTAAPPVVHEALRSPGEALDPSTRSAMEARFGHDFSKVRVHTDGKAAESAKEVDAAAYTVGRNIVFDAGQYSPHQSSGQQLLAHELGHVLQQSDEKDSPLRASITVGSQSSPLEAEADQMAAAALSGQMGAASSPGSASGVLQRQAADSTPAPTTEFNECDPSLQAQRRPC